MDRQNNNMDKERELQNDMNRSYESPIDADRARYNMSSDDDDKDEDDEEEKADWGDIDPQHNPLAPPGPMDPSGPGSAV